jgi:antitoxin component HigA of HigAB toxin-antitoxin module
MLTNDGYNQALMRIEELMETDPAPDTDEGRALIALVDSVIEYELEHFPDFRGAA